ncbi:MAG: tetratricopeptide repeat protein [Oceanicaulis sp.]
MFSTFLVAAALALQPAEAQTSSEPVETAMALLNAGELEGAGFDAAMADLRGAAEAGDGEAMVLLGSIAREGLIEGGEEEARAWYERARAEADGDTAGAATIFLALGYLFIEGDPAQGRALLEGLEATGDLAAERDAYLGYDLLLGIGGPADPELGQAMINGAIAQGFDNIVLVETAGDYWNDAGEDGARRSADDAMRLYKHAARLGSPSAAWRYAMLLLETGGSAQEAYAYVSGAAEQGFETAMISRAVMLATGEGVTQDAASARDWYARAARQGSAHAARGLGAMLVTGEGGAPDPATGYALLDIAARAGDEGAARLLERLPEDGHPLPDVADIEAAGRAWLTEAGIDVGDFE